MSITLLIAAAGIPRFFPDVSPRRVARLGLLAMFAGIVSLFMSMDVDASAEIVTVPLLLAGVWIGALASQLGSVTVSAVPGDESAEVGGLQNTATNLGASLGTALAGSLLIAMLTSSFLAGIEQNPAVPAEVAAQANVELAGGIPFISDADLEEALAEAGASAEVAQGVMDENGQARLDGLRTALAALGLIALLGLFFSDRIPTVQPGEARGRDVPVRRDRQ
ncbi:MAG TPA: hypothetical protein VHI11_09825 [Jiangellaceae bacterium]|nr:hypothetical protein [Jiangellaceae bacterium]